MPANRPPVEAPTSLSWKRLQQHFRLSVCETAVAEMLFSGSARKTIAFVLQRAPGTIRVFIDRLYHKMQVPDRLTFALRVLAFWHEHHLPAEALPF